MPVIRNADRLSLQELAKQSRELADKAQKKKLFPLDYEGGTFTVSNLGMLGVDSFIAIINPPQCAILAVGRVAPRVVAARRRHRDQTDDDRDAFRRSSRRRRRHRRALSAGGQNDCWKGLNSNSRMAKIVIRNLTKTYSGGEVVALQDINLEVEPNESLCILGPERLRQDDTAAHHRLSDFPRPRRDPDRRQLVTQPRPDVAMVFQHFGLFPWKRLDENIAYGLELRG